MIARRTAANALSVLHHLALLLGVIVFATPLLWLIATSLKTDEQIVDVSSMARMLLPHPVKWDNYPVALEYIDYFRALFNTVFVTVMSVIGVTLSCSLVAFSFARLSWPGRNVAFVLLLSTMMLPYHVTMIPVFLIFTRIGWVNTLRPLWIGSFFAPAFYVFLLRQFFLTIPKDLEDAAKIDGCGYFRIYAQIMLPLIRPAIISVVIFQFMAAWNDFIGPLIYVQDRKLVTLSLALQAFQSGHESEWRLLMAACVMMVLPVLVLFFAAQRYFIQGVTLTGLKT